MKTRDDLLRAMRAAHCTDAECVEVRAWHDSVPAQNVWDGASGGDWMLWLASRHPATNADTLAECRNACLRIIGANVDEQPANALAADYMRRAHATVDAYVAVNAALHALRYAHDLPQQTTAYDAMVRVLSGVVRRYFPEVPL